MLKDCYFLVNYYQSCLAVPRWWWGLNRVVLTGFLFDALSWGLFELFPASASRSDFILWGQTEQQQNKSDVILPAGDAARCPGRGRMTVNLLSEPIGASRDGRVASPQMDSFCRRSAGWKARGMTSVNHWPGKHPETSLGPLTSHSVKV